MLASASSALMTWHRRLGHLNFADLKKMKNGAVSGVSFVDDAQVVAKCEICQKGKQTRQPFNHVGTRATELLGIIHSDLCGPMEKQSIGGAKYFLLFIDDFSRKVFVYCLKAKTEVLDKFKEFKQMVENQVGKKIKILRTDNGSEYVGHDFQRFCKVAGIIHQTTNVYTPEQNGVAERMNRTIVEKFKCMVFDANLGKEFWGEAVNTAAYIINRTVTTSLNGKTPEGVWTGCKIDLSNLRIFGSPVMVHVPKQRRKKWDTKSTKQTFVGYSETTKGYRCVHPVTKAITVSRDVVFIEPNSTSICIDDDDREKPANITKTTALIKTDNEQKSDETLTGESINNDSIDTEVNDDFSSFCDSEVQDPTYTPNQDVETPDMIRRSERLAQQDVARLAINLSDMDSDPCTIEEAMAREDFKHWQTAMQSELDSLEENNTWNIVDLPCNRKAVKSKWVFKTKKDANGKIVRHKARLVAKGCSQTFGIDYNETFCPVVRYTSIRYLIALSVKLNLKICQMDAVTAFLQGDLDEEIYMQLPTGCGDRSGKICKLNKAIYGLKQSGRQWNLKLEKVIKSFGLIKSRVDPCVFYSKNSELIVSIYVDDLLIFWKDPIMLNKLKSSLSNAFKMKDMGVAKNCVGFNITYSKNGIAIDQSNYINDTLQRFGMSDCKPVTTPSDYNQKLSINMCEDTELNVPYQEAVGSLLYLAQVTRPDIAFAVNDVSRFNNKHGKAHWAAVKRIFRYLKGTINYKIFYSGTGKLSGFSDSDWASDIDKRRSCTGYVFTLCGGAISWGSKRQSTVALSSTEAE